MLITEPNSSNMRCTTLAEIGERIKEFRKEKHLTQKELADLVGMTPQVVSNYERGYSTPSAKDISDIASALNQDVASFYATTNSELHSLHGAPEWATEKDFNDLAKYLNNNTKKNFDGAVLDDEAIQATLGFLRGYFWQRRNSERQSKRDDTDE